MPISKVLSKKKKKKRSTRKHGQDDIWVCDSNAMV